jgi:hypothetical protein
MEIPGPDAAEMVAPALLFTIPLLPVMPRFVPEIMPKLLMVSAVRKELAPLTSIPMFVPVTDAPDWTVMVLPLS